VHVKHWLMAKGWSSNFSIANEANFINGCGMQHQLHKNDEQRLCIRCSSKEQNDSFVAREVSNDMVVKVSLTFWSYEWFEGLSQPTYKCSLCSIAASCRALLEPFLSCSLLFVCSLQQDKFKVTIYHLWLTLIPALEKHLLHIALYSYNRLLTTGVTSPVDFYNGQ